MMEKKINVIDDTLHEIMNILSCVSRKLSDRYDTIQDLSKKLTYEIEQIEKMLDHTQRAPFCSFKKNSGYYMMKTKQNLLKDCEKIGKDCYAAFDEMQKKLNIIDLALKTLEEDLNSLKIYNARMLEVFGTPNYGKEFVV